MVTTGPASIGSAKAGMQVLAHPCSEINGPAVVLQNVKGTRYIFGQMSEGFQRFMNQNKQKSSKLKHIFITGAIEWRTLGGLPGFLLTCNEQGTKGVHLHNGDKKLDKGVKSWRHFVFREALDIQGINCGNQIFHDEFVAVETVGFSQSKISSNYIIQILPSRGKFLVEVAKKLGVPKGVMYRQLSEGEPVTLENGTVVHPEQVLEPPVAAPRVIILDIPDESFLENVATYPWDKNVVVKGKRKHGEEDPSASPSAEVQIKLVYHFLGESVDFLNAKYLAMVKEKFPADCFHFVSHPHYTPNTRILEAAASLNDKLAAILPEYFGRSYTSPALKEFPSDINMRLLQSLDGMMLQNRVDYMPRVGDNSMEVNGIDSALDLSTYSVPEEPEVVSLGTGSSQPSKYRNVVSTVVRVPECTVMFDCGEGTVGSMKRLYGPSFPQRIREMKVLYISHMHADHHLGSVTLIQEWLRFSKEEESKLLVIGPGAMKRFLDEWSSLEPDLDMGRVYFLDIENYVVGDGYHKEGGRGKIESGRVASEELAQEYNIQSVKACRAFHCEYSYCVVIDINGFKVAYSGDTRPVNFFARLGLGSDLLIHEATHEDDLAKEAKAKRHSTVSEALKIGRAMEAKKIILTHFSQRYPKFPEVGGLSDDSLKGVVLAFDGMHVKLSQFDLQKERAKRLRRVFDEVEKEDVD